MSFPENWRVKAVSDADDLTQLCRRNNRRNELSGGITIISVSALDTLSAYYDGPNKIM